MKMTKPTRREIEGTAKLLHAMKNKACGLSVSWNDDWWFMRKGMRTIARWHIREVEQARNNGCHKQGSAK